MGLIKRATRFRIFSRDRFTCRYCGRRAPDVVLEIDHIVPKSRGGRDRLANLVTACFDCNRGKRASLLPASSSPQDVPALAWWCGDCCPHGCDLDARPPHATRPTSVCDDGESFVITYRGRCGHDWTTSYDKEYALMLAQQAIDEGIHWWPSLGSPAQRIGPMTTD